GLPARRLQGAAPRRRRPPGQPGRGDGADGRAQRRSGAAGPGGVLSHGRSHPGEGRSAGHRGSGDRLGAGRAGGSRRRHHRRRRPLRRRLPARPGPGAAAHRVPAARGAGRRRGHQPHRRPSADLAGRARGREGAGPLMGAGGPDWKTLGDEAVEIARHYLRIDTTNPPGNETPAAGILADAGLEPVVLESEAGRGNVVARLPGRAGDPAGALCLLHHLDVVPADPSEWSVDPFGAEVRDGYLWGRGAIDMKGMGVMQLMTMLALARDRTSARERDVVFVAVADEEAGGWKGAGWLTEHHPDLIACRDVINEGGYGLSETRPPIMACALSEKAVRWVRLTARGTPGHGSMPPVEQAIEKLLAALGDIAARPPALGLSPLVERTFRAMAAGASGVRRTALEAVLRPQARRLLPALGRRLPRYQRALLGDTISVTRLDAG